VKFVGIDGCRAGWFYVGVDDSDHFSVGIVPKIDEVDEWLARVSVMLIDIPIGLLSKGPSERLCDRVARQMIKPRGSTVFPAPARSALAKDGYEAGSAENLRRLGRKLSRQTWAIASKIKEVDDFLISRRPGSKIREMHPEVAFCGLNGGLPLLTRKKDREGFDERLSLLRHFYPSADKVVDAARRKFSKKELQNDDILDALVGAVTASHYPNLSTLPELVPLDDEGLPMEMVYAKSSKRLIGEQTSIG
jgi:predicted RNase H-like nuclease